ncbi:MAG: OmpA family protein [Oceanicaulis sp.]
MILRSLTAAALALGLAAACTTTDQYGNVTRNNAGTGVLLGAAGGALLGTLAGGDDARNAAVGAAAGAALGGGVGVYMDRQEEAYRERLRGSGVSVRRVGDELILTMPGDITFETDSSRVAPRFDPVLSDVADVMMTYPATYVDVIGHADQRGDASYNQALSERRASAVAAELIARGVNGDRFYVAGMGERQLLDPANNPTAWAANRRVEIKISPPRRGTM